MTRQEEIDALEKDIANLNIRVSGLSIKKMLLEQIKILRTSVAADAKILTSVVEPTVTAENKLVDASESQMHLILQKVDGLQSEMVHLKEALNLKESPSIDYIRIKDKKVKKQLIADNIRMEQARFDLLHYHDFHEEQAFRRYCTFAFFQVEQLLTYYYHLKFPYRMTELKRDFIVRGIEPKYIENSNKLNQVKSFVLIQAYNHEFFLSKNNPKTWGLDNLREVRNIEEHRCHVLLEPTNLNALEKDFQLIKEQETNGAVSSQRDKIIKNSYYITQFIRSRNFEGVKVEVENLYKNVTK